MLRDVLAVVTVVGAIGMLVIFAYGVHKHNEVLRKQREARNADRLARGEAVPTGLAIFKERAGEISPRMRLYVLLANLTLPLAVPVFAIGLAAESQGAVIAGVVLVALWLIDTAVVMPAVLAKASRAGRRV